MLMIFLPFIFSYLLFTRLAHPLSAEMILQIQTTLISLSPPAWSHLHFDSHMIY